MKALDMEKSDFNYNNWFLNGVKDSKPGYRRIINYRLLIHILLGVIFSFLIESSLKELSQTMVIPLIGVLFGLTLAWAGNAQGFLQTKEILQVSKNKKGGYIDYLFTYHLSILIIFVTAGLWILAGIQYKDIEIGKFTIQLSNPPIEAIFVGKALLFTMLSISVQECLSVIKGVRWFLIIRNTIFEAEKEKDENQKK